MSKVDKSTKVIAILGYPGRMISGSKSFYSNAYPDNLVVFNGNVCTKKGEKIWYGDLDVSKDEKALKELAKELGETIFVLRESDARFQNEKKPLLDRFVYSVDPNGTPTLGESTKEYFQWKNKKLKRTEEGK